MTGKPDPNILLAYDFGLRRIGVATGNLLTGTATPLTTLSVGSGLPWDRLDGLVEDWNPGRLIVGLPDPSRSGEISTRADAFADALVKRYNLPVGRLDESLTSRAAQSMLREERESGIMTKRVRKEDVDSRAACLIAEQWINARLDEDPPDSP